MEELEYREVPALVSWRLDSVTADIAKGTGLRIAKRARVEPCGRCANPVRGGATLRHKCLAPRNRGIGWNDARAVRVSNQVRTLGDASGAAVSIGEVAQRIEHCVPVATGNREDIRNLPASDHVVCKSGRVPQKVLAVAEG